MIAPISLSPFEIALFGALLLAALIYLSYTDFREMILPDAVTLPLVALGLVYAFRNDALREGAIGAAAGYLAFVAIEKGYKALRGRDGLGRGDAKLLAAGGAWCGWAALPQIVLIASLSGIGAALIVAWRARKQDRNGDAANAIPFGPHIALGIWVFWLAAALIGLGVLP